MYKCVYVYVYAYICVSLLFHTYFKYSFNVYLRWLARVHAPTKQPRQPFLSQSAVRQSANGGRLISQFQWRNACQPARVIPHVDCAMLAQLFLCLL